MKDLIIDCFTGGICLNKRRAEVTAVVAIIMSWMI